MSMTSIHEDRARERNDKMLILVKPRQRSAARGETLSRRTRSLLMFFWRLQSDENCDAGRVLVTFPVSDNEKFHRKNFCSEMSQAQPIRGPANRRSAAGFCPCYCVMAAFGLSAAPRRMSRNNSRQTFKAFFIGVYHQLHIVNLSPGDSPLMQQLLTKKILG